MKMMQKFLVCFLVSFLSISIISDGIVVQAEMLNSNEIVTVEDLTVKEEEVVDELTDEFNKLAEKYQGNKRGALTESVLNSIITDLAFDMGFYRDSTIANLVKTFSYPAPTALENWYAGLSNKQTLETTVFDIPTRSNVKLKAKYIDNGSDTTILLQHGFRSQGNSRLYHAQKFNDIGYNIIIPDLRGHGESEGEYITYGYYEKDDINHWLDLELDQRPEQDLLVLGVSMGAATTMMSQETPHENVLAYIADCGYQSLDEQLMSVTKMIYYYGQFVPVLNNHLKKTDKKYLVKLLDDRHVKPKLGFSIYDVSPLESVQKNTLPKLFLHGDADDFILMDQGQLLYEKAAGYKEFVSFAGSGHAVAIDDHPEEYMNAIMNFISTVRSNNLDDTKALQKTIAPRVNLLQNSSFNMGETNFDQWLVGNTKNTTEFQNKSLSKNKYGELVLQEAYGTDVSTAKQYVEGVQFFSHKSNSQPILLGQKVYLEENNEYILSMDIKNLSRGKSIKPNAIFGVGNNVAYYPIGFNESINKTVKMVPESNGKQIVKLGTNNKKKGSIFGYNYTNVAFQNVTLYNSDIIAPVEPQVSNIVHDLYEDEITISGTGEATTMIKVYSQDLELLGTTTVNEKGGYTLVLSNLTDQKFVHVVNEDKVENQSVSKVLYLR